MSKKVDPKPIMQETMRRLERIYAGHGLALLIFDFNKIEAGQMNWISNAKRADMIVALKEMVAQLEGRAVSAPESRQ